MTHQRHGLPGLHPQIHVREHGPARLVFERHVPELHAALERRQRPGVGRVLEVGLLIEQSEDALGAGHGRQRLIVLVAQNRDRGKKRVR
jgi:hypothetical protein